MSNKADIQTLNKIIEGYENLISELYKTIEIKNERISVLEKNKNIIDSIMTVVYTTGLISKKQAKVIQQDLDKAKECQYLYDIGKLKVYGAYRNRTIDFKFIV